MLEEIAVRASSLATSLGGGMSFVLPFPLRFVDFEAEFVKLLPFAQERRKKSGGVVIDDHGAARPVLM